MPEVAAGLMWREFQGLSSKVPRAKQQSPKNQKLLAKRKHPNVIGVPESARVAIVAAEPGVILEAHDAEHAEIAT